MEKADPTRILTNALRFVASGFEMATQSGVQAELFPSTPEAWVSPYARVCDGHKAILNRTVLQCGLLSVRLQDNFLTTAISQGSAQVEVSDDVGSICRVGGMAARDGDERYWLSESCIDYREIDGLGFELIAAFSLGEPDLRRFGYAKPIDRSAEVYALKVSVLFSEIFWFVFPTTRSIANELHEAIAARTGLIVPKPDFFVSE